jgi:hypothetical protein
MMSFESVADAQTFVAGQVDVSSSGRADVIDDGVQFFLWSEELDNGRFTNMYEVAWDEHTAKPRIYLPSGLEGVHENARKQPNSLAVTSGGFFFLADKRSGLPRQMALNLAMAEGNLRSLPVDDQEALLLHGEQLGAEVVPALGTLSLNGAELSWSGSKTTHEADCRIFGNGNSVIRHEPNEATGKIRVLDEASRFTPPIEHEGVVDIGFLAAGGGSFLAAAGSKTGQLDMFAHDIVARCPERYISKKDRDELKIQEIGGHAIDGSLSAALSVGPMLDEKDFPNHPVNHDHSLGSKPPFLDVPMARIAMYGSADGQTHLRLFDGRPGSERFPGVTPKEAVEIIASEQEIVWGCFLDPGQSAKMAVRRSPYEKPASYGNSHYLKWAAEDREKYIWVPEDGRPVASMIVLE